MKIFSLVLSLLLAVPSLSLANTEPHEEPGFLAKFGGAGYENIVDLVPFLSTTAISLLVAQLQPKDGAGNGNAWLTLALQHSAVAIPSAFSVSAIYGRVATIRESRKLVGNNVDAQNALTRQQDEVIAKYLFWVPASILAAKRLASSPDATARIGYIVATYLLASGKNSPFDLFKSGVASVLDSYRLESKQQDASKK